MKILQLEQRSPEWFQARLGTITGSRAKKVFASNNLPFVDELIAERMTQTVEDSYTSPAMEHGILFEPEALKTYNERTGNEALEVGYCVHDHYEWLAVSPDALVFDKGVAIGGVEIKCPSSKKHIEYIRQDKVPNEYKYQVYHYFIVIDTLEWLDFVTYDPRNSQRDIHVVRVTREELKAELAEVFTAYMKFYAKLEKYEKQIRNL